MLGNKTWHDHFIGKPGVYRVTLPFESIHYILQGASQKDASFHHCDSIHNGFCRIKSENFPCGIDSDCWERNDFCAEIRKRAGLAKNSTKWQ